MAGWNLADIMEIVAQEIPDSPAIVQGPKVLTFRAVDQRAQRVADYLTAEGLPRQAKVAQYLRNCPEYLESMLACFKGAFVPINTNYRYSAAELAYLWENGDTSAVVFHGSFASIVEPMRDQVPQVRLWLWVDDGVGTCPDWAVAYERVASGNLQKKAAAIRHSRNGDDLILLYTGGTTGMPKGVMWRQDDLFVRLNTERGDIYPPEPDAKFIKDHVVLPGRPHLPAGPLMHGAGLLTCFLVLSRGSPISLLQKASFDPVDLFDTVARDRVATLMWVGDAFARPALAALDAQPNNWDLGSLRTIMSSGVIFSNDVKQALLKHLPRVAIADVFGSSETMSLGRSVTSAREKPQETGVFDAKATTRVIDEHGKDVAPGSGEAGLLAIGGRQPIGYYKDETKTAATFRMLDGERYVVPGDWATIDVDGRIRLLGRGSECINTGGEKVFPEEIEAVLKSHEAIYDAVVVGIPDIRFGQSIAAAIEPKPGASIQAEEIMSFVKSRLAGYKAPRRIVSVASIDRGPNGKADLKAIRALCVAATH